MLIPKRGNWLAASVPLAADEQVSGLLIDSPNMLEGFNIFRESVRSSIAACDPIIGVSQLKSPQWI